MRGCSNIVAEVLGGLSSACGNVLKICQSQKKNPVLTSGFSVLGFLVT